MGFHCVDFSEALIELISMCEIVCLRCVSFVALDICVRIPSSGLLYGGFEKNIQIDIIFLKVIFYQSDMKVFLPCGLNF